MKAPVFATILMVIAFGILASLGTWQLKRLAWKEKILAEITAVENTDLSKPFDVYGVGLRAGTIQGQVAKEKIEVQRGASKQIYSFLKLEGGVLLPVRGLAKNKMTGYVQDIIKPNRFVPNNKPPQWYWLEASALEKMLGSKVIQGEFIPWHKADGPLPRPNNNHLQYALFWFAMAGVMVVIYILRFFGQGQK